MTGTLETARKLENQPWISIRGKDVEIELGGEPFVARAQPFLSWLHEQVTP